MIYSALFGVGKVCLLAWRPGLALLVFSTACAAYLYRRQSQPGLQSIPHHDPPM
jgi:hypothetical protein